MYTSKIFQNYSRRGKLFNALVGNCSQWYLHKKSTLKQNYTVVFQSKTKLQKWIKKKQTAVNRMRKQAALLLWK